jgi:hypothetical protein
MLTLKVHNSTPPAQYVFGATHQVIQTRGTVVPPASTMLDPPPRVLFCRCTRGVHMKIQHYYLHFLNIIIDWFIFKLVGNNILKMDVVYVCAKADHDSCTEALL